MQTRADLISRRCNRHRGSGARRDVSERRALRIVDDELFLVDAVQALSFENLCLRKTGVANPEASAQHNFRRSVLPSDTQGESQALRRVCVIKDFGLGFEAQSVTTYDVGAYYP